MLKIFRGKKKKNAGTADALEQEKKVVLPEDSPQETDNQLSEIPHPEKHHSDKTDISKENIPKANSEDTTSINNTQEEKKSKKGFFSRLKTKLSKTRSGLTDGLSNIFLGKKSLDDDLLEELETRLLMADVGVEATNLIVNNLVDKLGRKELTDSHIVVNTLRENLNQILAPCTKPLDINHESPFVILVVGVNGVGKTTTIGKLAKRFQSEGKSVMLAAGDTFRAAAVEQLQVWGERNNIQVVAQHTGADSASVLFDAVSSAKAKGVDVVIADTAGRLHTKSNLMEELKKIHRVIKKVDETAPHEVLLVLDASTGQNALSQATSFNEAVNLSGVCLTKLDGTAKGGIIFAIANKLKTPIRFIGVGEGIDDLREFNGDEFVAALFDDENSPE